MKRLIIKRLTALIFTIVFIGCSSEKSTEPEPEPTFDNFRDEVEYIIESNFTFGGVAAGIINGDEEFTVFHGTKSKTGSESPDENTIYEIGSITKTFTATILADFVVNGIVRLDDKIQDYLPADSVTVPSYNGSNISFRHLAVHTSGLTRNFSDDFPLPAGTPSEDPFALIKAEHIYNYLNNYVPLLHRPGSEYFYSNFGYGLLGFVLSRINNSSYEELLKETVLNVLGMNHTSITVRDEHMNNIAVGYDKWKNNVEWLGSDHDLVGAGGIKSTLKDMMAYLKAYMGILDTQLNETVALARQQQPGNFICLGWHLRSLSDGQTVILHGGATYGCISFIGFTGDLSTGVVILYNYTASLLPDEVAMRIFQVATEY